MLRRSLFLLLSSAFLAPSVTASIVETALPDFAGMPRDVASDDHGAVWITSDEAWGVVRYTPTARAFDVASLAAGKGKGNSLSAITVAADGSVWAGSAEHVHRVDPVKLTALSLPVPDGSDVVGGFAMGPDGALWEARTSADRFVRIDLAAAVATQIHPASPAHPIDVATLGGKLYFVDLSQVSSIDATKASPSVTLLHDGLDHARTIAAGGDSLWVGEENALARLGTTGGIARYAVPGTGAVTEVETVGANVVWAMRGGATLVHLDVKEGILYAYKLPGTAFGLGANATTAWTASFQRDALLTVTRQDEPTVPAAVAAFSMKVGGSHHVKMGGDAALTFDPRIQIARDGDGFKITATGDASPGTAYLLVGTVPATGDLAFAGRYVEVHLAGGTGGRSPIPGTPALAALAVAACLVLVFRKKASA